MTETREEPIDLINDVFTVAYLMTGSMKTSNELVFRTFQLIDSPDVDPVEIYSKFRTCCYEEMSHEHKTGKLKQNGGSYKKTKTGFHHQEIDRKLTVLLSEICRLKHMVISRIIGRPPGTVRSWSSSGRKSFRQSLLMMFGLISLAVV